MSLHGDTIMQACMVAIESSSVPSALSYVPEHLLPERIHMHALCMLGCVASGDETSTVQKYLVDNESLMIKIVEYISSSHKEVKLAMLTRCIFRFLTLYS